MAQITLNSSGVASNGSLLLQSNGTTTAVTIDTAQNLGLGVTPSAWVSTNKALQVGTAFLQADGGGVGSIGFGRNAYQASGGWVYRANGYANMLNIETDGAYKFFNAPSGTAGNAITFTQAMTLDASGNLLVGATSAAGNSKGYFYANANTSHTVRITNASAGSSAYANLVVSNDAGNVVELGMQSSTRSTTYPANEAWMYTSNGINIGYTGDVKFYAGGVEQARVITIGIVPKSTTVPTGGLGGSVVFAKERVYFGDNTGWTWDWYTVNTGGTTFRRFYYTDAGAAYNATGTWGSISDAKLKENIVDATPKLAGLMQVKVRNYNLIGETTKQIGVVAQELETVFPAMVENTVDKDEEGNELGTVTKAVKYSVFVPMLIKAIQEQQALITQLQADVAALKA